MASNALFILERTACLLTSCILPLRRHLCRYSLCGHRMQNWQDFTNSIEGFDLHCKSLANEEVVISRQRLVDREFLADLLNRVSAPLTEASILIAF